jgi:AcrR family transcriptional regulator
MASGRVPLTRERVLRAAMRVADEGGLEAASMRRVAQELGVEAMSLYKHVANKDALLDGLVELVFEEIGRSEREDWIEALREQALAMRGALLRHRWAALLIESRVTSGPNRLRLHEATLGALRRGGLTVAQAYSGYLTLDSYIYGFALQEVSWPFEADARPEVIHDLAPAISPEEYPHLTEIMGFVLERTAADGLRYQDDFLKGLDMVLGAMQALAAQRAAR